MGKAEGEGDDGKGEPAKGSERDLLEPLRDQVAEQKSAPENLLHQRHDHDEPDEAQDQASSSKQRGLAASGSGLNPTDARGEMKELLGRNPKHEDKQSDRDGEDRPPKRVELVFPPEENQEPGAEKSLERIEPELRRRQPE